MDKKELFDLFDGFSEKILLGLNDLELVKKQVQDLLEENSVLRIENSKLRERLSQLEQTTVGKSTHSSKEFLEEVYNDGFHVCHTYYGQRLDEDYPSCMNCLEVIYRD